MARRIRAFDWSRTPVGPIKDWPQSLKTATGLVVASPVPIVMLWGPHGVMIYNDAYSVFAGGRHPQLLGSNVLEGWPEVADFNANVMKVGLAGGTLAYKDQELTLHRHGRPEQVWMNLDYWPVPGEDGAPAGVIATVVETTEQVAAERRQAEASERLQLALSAGRGIGAWDWDVASDRVYSDDRFAKLYGVSPDKAAGGAPIGEFFSGIHPDDLPRVQEEIAVALNTGNLFSSEYRLVQPDGAVRWVTAEGRPVMDVEGRPLRFPGVSFDITDQRRLSDALVKNEARYRALFDNINVGFCIIEMLFDDDGGPCDYRFIEINPAFAAQTGLANAVGRRVRELSPTHEQHWFDFYGAVATTGQPARIEQQAVGLGRWWDAHAYRIGDPADRQVAVLFNDITARKRTELRQGALIALGDALSNLTDPVEIAYRAARALGEALGASRVGYGVIDPVAATILVERDWTAEGQPSVAGLHDFRRYGDYVPAVLDGESVTINDVETDPRTAPDPGPLLSYGIRALMDVPVTENGRVVSQLLVHSDTPRQWSPEEVAFVRDFAGRTQAAIARRRAEIAARENEAGLRDLNAELERKVIERTQARGLSWQVSPDLMGALGPDSRFKTSNPAWEATLGWTEAEVAEMSIFDMLHPDDVERTRVGFELTQVGKPAIRFPNRYRTKNGDYRWISWVGVFEDGMVYCVGRDITEEVAAEAERKQLWTLSEDMLARADYAGGLVAVNPAWTRTLGWTEQELLTNPYADIISPANLPQTTAALAEMGETGQPTRFENRILSKDGVWKPIGWTVAPEPDGVHFIAVGRDLTEDKAREQDLADAQEALRQSQKMEAVGQLTGGIAHDFNNLLAGISGSLELLQRRLHEGRLAGVERYIDAAQGASQRAAALTQRLLAFSRRQTLDPKPVAVNRLIGGMEDLIRRTVGPDIEVEVVGAAGLWTTRVDPSQLENALLNLCINARDAMAPHAGRLTIETANKWLDDRGARERELTPGQYISLCVTDTGSGIPIDIVDKIFDPFFTTKPIGQGTGLGLSMIHGFVRQSGGQVRVYSEPDKGTTMCLYLPRYTGDLDAVDSLDPTLTGHPGHGETVLLIDDEPTVRMLASEVLGDAGYTVIEAVDGPSGLQVLDSDVRIDLLVTDVGLPGGLNGRQVADAARIKRPGLKVLFITGYAENAAVGNGLLDVGMAILTKPFVMTDLINKVG